MVSEEQIEVRSVKYKELRAHAASEDSATIRARVMDARKRQPQRFKGEKATSSNAQMAPKIIRKHCAIFSEGEKLLETAVARLGLSARAHDRILKVSRTIADLDAAESIEPKHLRQPSNIARWAGLTGRKPPPTVKPVRDWGGLSIDAMLRSVLPIQRFKIGIVLPVTSHPMGQDNKHLEVVLDTQVESVNLAEEMCLRVAEAAGFA